MILKSLSKMSFFLLISGIACGNEDAGATNEPTGSHEDSIPTVDLTNPCSFVLEEGPGFCLLIPKWSISNPDSSVLIPETQVRAHLYLNQDWDHGSPVYVSDEATKFGISVVIKGLDNNNKEYGRSYRLQPSSELSIYAEIANSSNLQNFADAGDPIFIKYNDQEIQIGEFLTNPSPGEYHRPVTREIFEHPSICEGDYKDICSIDLIVASDVTENFYVRDLFDPTDPFVLPQIGFGYRLSLSSGASFLFTTSINGTPVTD